jgi:hypothetical protein
MHGMLQPAAEQELADSVSVCFDDIFGQGIERAESPAFGANTGVFSVGVVGCGQSRLARAGTMRLVLVEPGPGEKNASTPTESE